MSIKIKINNLNLANCGTVGRKLAHIMPLYLVFFFCEISFSQNNTKCENLFLSHKSGRLTNLQKENLRSELIEHLSQKPDHNHQSINSNFKSLVTKVNRDQEQLLQFKLSENALKMISYLSQKNLSKKSLKLIWTDLKINKNEIPRITRALIYLRNLTALKNLDSINYFEMNRDFSNQEFSYFILAVQTQHRDLINWFMTHPEFNLNQKSFLNLTNEKLLSLFSHKLLVELNLNFYVTDLKSHILNDRMISQNEFLTIPGGFYKDPEFNQLKSVQFVEDKATQNISTKTLELARTKTTQSEWNQILELSRKYLTPEELKNLNLYATLRVNHKFHPKNYLHSESFESVTGWLKLLNTLSLSDFSDLQAELSKIFPGHIKGALYALPTHEIRNYVSYNFGFSHQKSIHDILDSKVDSSLITKDTPDQQKSIVSGQTILGQLIIDFWGDLSEMTQSSWSSGDKKSDLLFNGKKWNSTLMTVRGGHSGLTESQIIQHEARPQDIYEKSHLTGFRLIRIK